MARQKRIWYEGACYHVMGRGTRKMEIFRDSEDYHYFLQLVAKIKKKIPFCLHAYCLMTNHFHMEITTQDAPIWEIMKPLLQCYATGFNHKYDLTGHLFESRYTSCIINNNDYFLEVSRYIHLNPVKAAMVDSPLAYQFSSYSQYVSDETEGSVLSVDTSPILSEFYPHAEEQYRSFVQGNMSHAEQELLIQKDMKENDMWLPS